MRYCKTIKFQPDYERWANEFRPTKIKVLFIGESPPCPVHDCYSPKELPYFYNPDQQGKFGSLNSGFAEALDQEISDNKSKREFLALFKEKGLYLIDYSMEPQVCRHMDVFRNAIPGCISRVNKLKLSKDTKIVFVLPASKYFRTRKPRRSYDQIVSELKNGVGNYVYDFVPFPSRSKRKVFVNKVQKIIRD